MPETWVRPLFAKTLSQSGLYESSRCYGSQAPGGVPRGDQGLESILLKSFSQDPYGYSSIGLP